MLHANPHDKDELTRFPYRLDKLLKEEGISSDELVEVCGASGSGKTYFCLKMVSLALIDKNVAAIYIDTSNYVNSDNMTLFLRVSLSTFFVWFFDLLGVELYPAK